MNVLFPPLEWRHDQTFGTDGSPSEILCWSRMQAEAGQELAAIMARKELERLAGDGLFFWGIGNAPSRAVGQLARVGHEIDVVFSVMKSRPKAVTQCRESLLSGDGSSIPMALNNQCRRTL
jgi:hypothetical protein